MAPTRENVTVDLPVEPAPSSVGLLHSAVRYWIEQIKLADTSRSAWKIVADQCQTFYAGTAMSFWDRAFLNKYVGQGIEPPKFQIWIAKSFEFVAVMGPQVFWKNPRRQMVYNELRSPVDPMELAGIGLLDEMSAQQIIQAEQIQSISSHARMQLFETVLNYMPDELPGGGAGAHAEVSTIEAMVKGRGMLVARTYKVPGSDRTMTGMVHKSVDHLYIDPDCEDPNLNDAGWIAIRNVTLYTDLEKRFNLPRGTLKSCASVSSAEWNASKTTVIHPASTERNFRDMVVWYEVYSRRGLGLHNLDSPMVQQLENVAGPFCYMAICEGLPYPLNAAPARISQMSDQQVGQQFSWPTPLWRCQKFPVAILDFYKVPRCPWPLPPLAMCLGELVALNVLVSCMVTRGHSSAQEIIGLIKEAQSDIEAKLRTSQSPVFVPIARDMGAKIDEIISFIQRPDISNTTIQAIQMLMDLIDKRTGLVAHVYGESPTQDRSAQTTQSKDERASIRPEHMRKKVGDWLREAGDIEKCVAGWNLKPEDVQPILGVAGALAWNSLVTQGDPDNFLLDLKCHIEVSDMQRPDQQHKQNVVQMMNQTVLPMLERYSMATGQFDQVNAYLDMLGETNEVDLTAIHLQAPHPQEQQIPPEQQAVMEAQAREAQATAAEAELGVQKTHQQMLIDWEKAAAEQKAMQIETESKIQQMQLESEQAAIENLVTLADAQTKSQTAQATVKLKAKAAAKPQAPKKPAKR